MKTQVHHTEKKSDSAAALFSEQKRDFALVMPSFLPRLLIQSTSSHLLTMVTYQAQDCCIIPGSTWSCSLLVLGVFFFFLARWAGALPFHLELYNKGRDSLNRKEKLKKNSKRNINSYCHPRPPVTMGSYSGVFPCNTKRLNFIYL